MKPVDVFIEDKMVIKRGDCDLCHLSIACIFNTAFRDFLNLGAIVFEKNGCPRNIIENDGLEITITEKPASASAPVQ